MTDVEHCASDILRIASRHGITKVRVFGSFARNSAQSDSDIDLLVTPEPGRDLLDLIAMQQELEEYLGLRVDIVTENGLSPYLRETILQQAKYI